MNERPSAEELVNRQGMRPASSTHSGCLCSDDLRRGLLGELSQDDQAGFERHILNCEACQQRLDQFDGGTFLRLLRNRAGGFNRLSHDVETVAYISSRLTPSGAHLEASCSSAEEFIGNQRFRIDRRLGSGGMGIVYQAYDLVR